MTVPPAIGSVPQAVRTALLGLQARLKSLEDTVAGGGGGGGVTDHGALTGLADDDHTQYHTDARGDARYALRSNNLSDLANAVTARTNLGLGGAAVLNVGTAAGTVAAGDDSRITGAAQKSANLSDLANAVTARTNLGLGGAAVLNVGTTAGTVAAGDDSRITGAAQKSANLSDLANAVTARTNLGLGTAATLNVPAAGDAAAGEVVKGNDSRLTNARTPSAHASSHSSGGSDQISHNNLAGLTTGDPHTQYAQKANNLSDLANAATARTNLGLGSLATLSSVGTGQITNNAVDNTKLATVASGVIKGRVTAATGNVEDLTGTQVTTLLDVFTSSLKGLVPASGGGTSNFLRADGTWAAPPGGGGGSLVVQEDDVTVDAAVTTIDFGNGFDVTSSPAGEANVVLDLGEYTGADLPVAGGGTGASDAATARTNLGVGNVGTLTYPGTTTTYLRGDGTFQTLPSAALLAGAKTADQTLGTSDTYVSGSNINVAGRQQAGTTIRWRLAITKTAAGTAAPVFNVRVGTAGTTADTARFAWTGVAQTAATDTAIVTIEVTIRSISASGSLSGNMLFAHKNTTTGFANAAQEQIFAAVATGVDTTISPLTFGISINAGASSAWTVNHCSVEAINLS